MQHLILVHKNSLAALAVYAMVLVALPVFMQAQGTDSLVAVSLTVSINHLQAVVVKGQKAKVVVTLQNHSSGAITGLLTMQMIADDKQPLKQQIRKISIPANRIKQVKVRCRPAHPGFYSLVSSFEYSHRQQADSLFSFTSFGYLPQAIHAQLTQPEDFIAFWDKAKEALAAVSPEFHLIPAKEFSTATREVYIVEMRSLDNALIREYYVLPKGEGPFPAVLRLQGYYENFEPKPEWEGFAVFYLNVRGHGNSRDDIKPDAPFIVWNIADKNKYFYRGAYMDCIRAMDFLYTRREIDTTRIAVAGGSQGGALSVATAALDKRVKYCLPDMPFLSDFRRYFRIASFPRISISEFLKANPQLTWEQVHRTLDYVDIKNLAPLVHCPVLMSVGLQDTVCPPYINFAFYNQLTVPKEYRIYSDSGHKVPAAHYTYKEAWLRKRFGMNYTGK